VKEILDTILDPGSQPGDFAALPLPEAYRAVTLHRDEEHMFDGIHTRDRDPRKSLHVEEVPVPELGMGEALIAVMASAVGIAAILTWPTKPRLRASISWRIALASPTIRRAHSSTLSPSGVNPWNREPRCTSNTPNMSSRYFIPPDNVGWLTRQVSAARPK